MTQKFKRYSFVHVTDRLPESMKHFEKDFYAIVGGSYAQMYGGDDTKEYSLYLIKNNKVVNESSWYEEDQLTLLPIQDLRKAVDMVDAYLQGE